LKTDNSLFCHKNIPTTCIQNDYSVSNAVDYAKKKHCFTNFLTWIKGSVIIDFSTKHNLTNIYSYYFFILYCFEHLEVSSSHVTLKCMSAGTLQRMPSTYMTIYAHTHQYADKLKKGYVRLTSCTFQILIIKLHLFTASGRSTARSIPPYYQILAQNKNAPFFSDVSSNTTTDLTPEEEETTTGNAPFHKTSISSPFCTFLLFVW